MRVISGVARGRPLQAPPGRQTRPTSDRVKEALFNVIAPRLNGARVLDLFAGSGALAIEALSRGAAAATLIDSSSQAVRTILSNLESTGLAAQARVSQRDVTAALAELGRAGQRFDLILLDPPYGHSWLERCLPLLAQYELLADGGLIVTEHARREQPPALIRADGAAAGKSLRAVRRLDYGDTSLSLYQWATDSDGEVSDEDRALPGQLRPGDQRPSGRD